jgi:hypothetical protein
VKEKAGIRISGGWYGYYQLEEATPGVASSNAIIGTL